VYPAAIGVAAIAYGIGWLLERAWRRSTLVGAGATLAATAALAGTTAWFDAIRDTRRIVVTPFVEARWVGGLDPSGLPRWVVIVATIATVVAAGVIRLRYRINRLDVPADPVPPRSRRHRLAALAVVAIVVGLVPATLDRVRSSWQGNAFDRTSRSDGTYTRIDVYPASARRAAERIEPGSIVFAGFNDIRRIASLTPVQSVEESELRELMEDPPDRSFAPILDAAAADPARFEDRSAGTLRVFRVRRADG
jgi:hypothetical protein